MSAEQDWADALLVDCAVTGCERAAGRYCVNITDGETYRDQPHWSRVLAGRVVRGKQAVTTLPLDDELAALEASEPTVGEAAARLDETTAAILAKAETMPDGDTSARLRRVEVERVEWLAAAQRWSARYAEACQAGLTLQAEMARVERERDELATEVHVLRNSEAMEIVAAEARQRIAEAELASARTELEQLRAQLRNPTTQGDLP